MLLCRIYSACWGFFPEDTLSCWNYHLCCIHTLSLRSVKKYLEWKNIKIGGENLMYKMKSVLVRQWRYGSIIFNFVKMNRVAFNSTPLSLLWLMFCAMINASDPTFHLFCGFKYPPSCFCVCWKIKMQIISMKQVNFVNSSIHHGGLKYPPWWIGLSTILICVYFENKNAYLKQETSEIVVKSIHHGGLLFNCIIINLKSSENKERWRLSTISIVSFNTNLC